MRLLYVQLNGLDMKHPTNTNTKVYYFHPLKRLCFINIPFINIKFDKKEKLYEILKFLLQILRFFLGPYFLVISRNWFLSIGHLPAQARFTLK